MGQYTGRWTPPPDAIPQFSFDFREPLGPVEAPPNLPWLGPLPPWAGQDKPKVPTIGLKESLLNIGPRPDFNRRNFGQGEPIQRWTPPPDAIPQGQAPPEEPSFGRKIWNALDYPMADIRRRTPEVYEATERAAQPSVFHTPEEREQAIRFKKLNVGADILSGFTTPLNVGLGVTSGAAMGTASIANRLNAVNPYRANQLKKIAGALEAPGRAAAYGMAAGGIADIVDPESDTAERLGGVAETALGAYWGKRLTPKAKRTWAVGYERGVPAGYQGPAKQLPRFAGEGTPAEYRSGARFVGREGGGVYDREGGLVDLGPQEAPLPHPPVEEPRPFIDESESLLPPRPLDEIPGQSQGRGIDPFSRDELDRMGVRAVLKSRGLPTDHPISISPSTPIGQLKPVGRGSTVPETPRFDVGDVELQQAPDMSQEITLPLRTPQAPPPTGKITYQRIAGRNVKLIDGVPEDQAGERELIQEPNIQRTPENEALLRKFFNDESGTMDFDEMRRRFLAIRKGEAISETEKKGVAEFEKPDLTFPFKDRELLDNYLALSERIDTWPKDIERRPDLQDNADRMQAELIRRGWNPQTGQFPNAATDTTPYSDKLGLTTRRLENKGLTAEQHIAAIQNETDPQKIKDNLDDLKRQMDNRDPNISTEESNTIIKLYLTASERFAQSQRKNLEPFTSKEQDMIRGMAGEPPKLKPIAGGRFGELPGKLKPIPRQIETGPDSYETAKRNLDERNRRGEVTDYVEELEELNRQHGVIDTMSEETSKLMDEVRSAADQGFVTLNPKSHHAPRMKREGWTLAGRLSDGTLVLDYPPGENSARVGKPYQAKGEQEITTKIPDEEPQFSREMGDARRNELKIFIQETKEEIRRIFNTRPLDIDRASKLFAQQEKAEAELMNEPRPTRDIHQKDKDLLKALFDDSPANPWIVKSGDSREIRLKRAQLKKLEDKRNQLIDERDKTLTQEQIDSDYGVDDQLLDDIDEARYNQLEKELRVHDGDTDIEGPEFSKTIETKIKSNVKREAKELTTGYSAPLEQIMIREGAQNSFDATRMLGAEGKVEFTFLEKNGDKPASITVKDNGKGMSPEELRTVYSTLHESGKTDEAGAVGGKGVGKAPYMLGGDHFKVDTVKIVDGKKVHSWFSGKPDELMEKLVIHFEDVPMKTPVGTTFTTTLSDEQTAMTGRVMLSKIMKYSRGQTSKVTSTRQRSWDPNETTTEDETWNDSPLDLRLLDNFKLDDNIDIDLIVPERSRLRDASYVEAKILNNGMYQYSQTIYLEESTPGMPDEIIINIKPKAEEGSKEYPFGVQRESVKDLVQEKLVRIVQEKLANPKAEQKKVDLVKLWASMPVSPAAASGTFRDSVIYDAGDRLSVQEKALFDKSPIIRDVSQLIDHLIEDILHKTGRIAWQQKVVRTGIILFEETGGKVFGIHIPNPGATVRNGESAIMINNFSHQQKYSPKDAAEEIVITGLHEAGHVGNEAPSAMQLTEAELNDPEVGKYLQSYIKHVLSATGGDAGHGVNFIKRLGEIYGTFGPELYNEYQRNFRDIFEDRTNPGSYRPELQKLLQIYSESRGRPSVTEDILSGTGTKQADKGRGPKGNIPSSDKPNGDGVSRPNDPAGKSRKYGGFPRQPKIPANAAGKAAASGKNQQAPITPETQDIRYPAGSIQRLKDALQAGKLLQPYKLQMQHLERSRRAGMIAGVQDPGLKGYFQKLGMLRGPLTPDIPIESKLTQHDLDALLAGITNSTLLPYSKLTAQGGLVKLFTGDIPTGSESRLLGKVFGEDLPKLIELHAGLGFAGQGGRGLLYGAINVPKSLMSAMDLSYTLRQAAPFMLTGEYWKSFQQMWKSFPDEEAFNGAMQSIYDDPVYEYFQQFNRPLFIGEFKKGSELALREEAFGSDIAARIPLMAGMGRMQTAFINKLRFDVAKRLLGDMYKSGYIDWAEGQSGLAHDQADKDVQRMLDFVNNFTGRGNLGAASRIAPFLNAAFFSPAFQMSRAHILASPFTYLNAPKAVRNEAWKSMFAIMSMIGIGIVLTKAMGGDVSDDPDDTDYGKGRFGNTRIDFSQGLQPIIVAGHRMASGRSKSPDKVDKSGRLIPGKEYDIGKTFTGPTIRSIIGNFFINKTSPIGGLINVWSQGEQAFAPGGVGGAVFPGREKGNMTKAAALNMVFPMVVSDMVDLYKEDPNISPRGLSFLLAAVLGLPVQTFETPKLKNPFDRGFQVPANSASQPQYQDQSPGMLIPPPAQEQQEQNWRLGIGITLPRGR